MLQNVEKTDHSVRFQVSGLSCASCVRRAEQAMLGVDGVTSAEVNLATGRADVEFDTPATASRIRAASAEAGYPAVDLSEADQAPDEAKTLQSDVWWALALSAPVVILAMGAHMFPPFHHWVVNSLGTQTSWVIQFVLTTVVLVFPGRRFFTKGYASLARRAPDMNALVAIGAGAAWVFSSLVTFVPALFPQSAHHVYFESSAMIVTLILLGRLLEARAKGRASDAIKKLIALTPETATVEEGGTPVTRPIAAISIGDILQLKPGERVAVDGVVLSGQSYVDESMITGEPEPVAKVEQALLTAGTVNGTGALRYRATAVGQDTVLARIVEMVENAQGGKLPVQALVDRVAAVFVPIVLVIAALTVAIWLAVGPDPAASFALVAGVSVLIIACPCAMGLATPMSIMVGTGRAAELGVLFRRGDALQALQGVTTIALDKTGTLTMGAPDVTDFEVAKGLDRSDVLALVAAVESQSEHPVARAIVAAATENGSNLPPVDDFRSITGQGVSGQIGDRHVLVGNRALMQANGIDIADWQGALDTYSAQAKTPFLAAVDGKVAAVFAVADPLKPSAPAALEALRAMGLNIVMLTGDVKATANAVAADLAIDRVEAALLPGGKIEAIDQMQNAGERVAFVGDGINDAPALAQADVGLAVGTGTDVAIETADVVLMSGDLRAVVDAVDISRRTLGNIRQNLFWAFGYNVVLIPVAAGVLYPLFGVLLSPMFAAAAMGLSSVFVVTNALRLKRGKSAERVLP